MKRGLNPKRPHSNQKLKMKSEIHIELAFTKKVTINNKYKYYC